MLTFLKKYLKRPLSSLLYCFYSWKAQSLPPQMPLGTLLVIAPHPDDESFGCGALIAKHVQAKQPVHIVIITDGSGSTPATTIATTDLVKLRQKEGLAAAEALGVPANAVTFLNYKDGFVHENSAVLEQDLKEFCFKLNPVWILAPFAMDDNSDHETIGKAILRTKPEAPILSYPLWFWPKKAMTLLFQPYGYRFYKLDARPFLKTKKTAIQCHRSQFENITNAEGWGYLDSHIINMQMRPYELYFTLQDLSKSP